MKLGIIAGYSPATMSIPMDMIQEAERLGFSSVWTAEAWGSDAVSPAAWILAQTEKINVGTAIMLKEASQVRLTPNGRILTMSFAPAPQEGTLTGG